MDNDYISSYLELDAAYDAIGYVALSTTDEQLAEDARELACKYAKRLDALLHFAALSGHPIYINDLIDYYFNQNQHVTSDACDSREQAELYADYLRATAKYLELYAEIHNAKEFSSRIEGCVNSISVTAHTLRHLFKRGQMLGYNMDLISIFRVSVLEED